MEGLPKGQLYDLRQDEERNRAYAKIKESECDIPFSFFRTDKEWKTKRNLDIEKFRQKLQKVTSTIFGDTRELKPTIINPESNFVVVTYWWGHSVLNKNYARPCPSFYEEFFKLPIKMIDEPSVWETLKAQTFKDLLERREYPASIKNTSAGVKFEKDKKGYFNIGKHGPIPPIACQTIPTNLIISPLEIIQAGGVTTAQVAEPGPAEDVFVNSEVPEPTTDTTMIEMSYLCNLLTHHKIFYEQFAKKVVNAYISGRKSALGEEKTPSVRRLFPILLRIIHQMIDTNSELFLKIINTKKCIEKYGESKRINMRHFNAVKRAENKIKSYESYIQQINQQLASTKSPELIYRLKIDLKKAENDLKEAQETHKKAKEEKEKSSIKDEPENRPITTALREYLDQLQKDLTQAYKSQYAIVEKAFGSRMLERFSEEEKATAQKNGIRGYMELIMQYKPPITFDKMIEEWEMYCRKTRCNYMAVEYKAFEGPEGYQLAINAKPDFVKKALDVCATGDKKRAVLYIDGDMIIRSYPQIFDMPDVDYMARGWNMDPRGSDKFTWDDYSVSPYRFETSGGTMYFNQTDAAKRLLDLWILETRKDNMRGKADDRIISLMFNQQGLMAPLRILQLPVEYLYLDQWYDDYLNEDDENIGRVYISHPQCLTSEDTAAGSGASSSREPESYKRILGPFVTGAEPFYESVVFPELKYADGFRGWLSFIKGLKYTRNQLNNMNLLRLNNRSLFETEPWGSYGQRTKQFQINSQLYEYHFLNKVLQNKLLRQSLSFESLKVANHMQVIPKIVHQIWFGNSQIPVYKQAMMNSVRDAAHCAGWQYKLWVASDYKEKNFPNVWRYCKKAEEASKRYGQSRWAQVADLCRYELICRFGGVYLDTNFFASHRLFSTIEEMNTSKKLVIMCNEDPCGLKCGGKAGKYMSNSFIASARHHLVFQHLISEEKLDSINIDREKTLEEELGSMYLNQTTGPYYLRSGLNVLENEFGEVGVLEPETIYPMPMSDSELRDPVENRCLVKRDDVRLQDPTIQYVIVDDSRALITNIWEKEYPGSLTAYMRGLGGSWDYSETEAKIKEKWRLKGVFPLPPQNIAVEAQELTAAAVAEADRDAPHPPAPQGV